MATASLFSVSYAGLWGQHRLDLSGFLRKAAQLGYPAVQLMGKRPHLSTVDVDEVQADQLRRMADQAGVEIATIAAYTNFTLAQGTEIPAVEFQVAYVGQLARLAQRLGAKILRVFTGYTTEPEAYARDWDVSVRAIRECARIAADHGVLYVAYEMRSPLRGGGSEENLDQVAAASLAKIRQLISRNSVCEDSKS